MRRRVLLLAAAPLVVIAVSCGVSRSSSVKIVDPNVIPFNLADTTTTTTLPPTTTTLPSTTSTVDQTTTTAVETEPIDLYYIAGNKLVVVKKPLPRPASPQQVLALLFAGPPEGSLGAGLRTALPRAGGLAKVRVAGGVATVDLPQSVIAVPAADQRLAIGQIVLTLYRPGIGQVTFTVGGAPYAVPRGDGSVTTAGERVTVDDYRNLLDGA